MSLTKTQNWDYLTQDEEEQHCEYMRDLFIDDAPITLLRDGTLTLVTNALNAPITVVLSPEDTEQLRAAYEDQMLEDMLEYQNIKNKHL